MTVRVIHNADCLSNVTSAPYTRPHRGYVSLCYLNILCPYSCNAKTFTGLLLMCWAEGAVEKTTLPKPDTSHKSIDFGFLYYVSSWCGIHLCYSFAEQNLTALEMIAHAWLPSVQISDEATCLVRPGSVMLFGVWIESFIMPLCVPRVKKKKIIWRKSKLCYVSALCLIPSRMSPTLTEEPLISKFRNSKSLNNLVIQCTWWEVTEHSEHFLLGDTEHTKR